MDCVQEGRWVIVRCRMDGWCSEGLVGDVQQGRWVIVRWKVYGWCSRVNGLLKGGGMVFMRVGGGCSEGWICDVQESG